MKLATYENGTRDGQLRVVDRSLSRCIAADSKFPTMQAALDQWTEAEPRLRALSDKLDSDASAGEAFDVARCLAPLPRAYEWVDGSAYINHIVLVRKARGAEPPETLRTSPLVYQGGSSEFLAPTQSIPLGDPAWGLDFESEICVVLDDTPRSTSKDDALTHVRLLMLANDVTYRNLIPPELAKGFGFFTSKPATGFSPVAVTPDEMGDAWRDGRVHLQIKTHLNGELAGDPHAGPEMFFSFADLIAHITKTRGFGAGAVLGSGTVSNEDPQRGVSCLAESRMREIIESGSAKTEFLKDGDVVRIEMHNADGNSIFGAIEQKVVK